MSNTNKTNPEKTLEQSTIDEMHREIEGHLASLEEIVKGLRNKLGPVIKSTPHQDVEDPLDKYSLNTERQGELGDVLQKLVGLRALLEDLLSDVDP